VTDDNAPKIATYLKGRAQGLTGTHLAEKSCDWIWRAPA